MHRGLRSGSEMRVGDECGWGGVGVGVVVDEREEVDGIIEVDVCGLVLGGGRGVHLAAAALV